MKVILSTLPHRSWDDYSPRIVEDRLSRLEKDCQPDPVVLALVLGQGPLLAE